MDKSGNSFQNRHTFGQGIFNMNLVQNFIIITVILGDQNQRFPNLSLRKHSFQDD